MNRQATPLDLPDALDIWPLLPGEPSLDAPAAAGSRVYLLHFGEPFRGANGRHPGAQHYVGVALDGDVQRRLAEHLAGHGSPLVRAVVAAGIRVDLVLDVPGDRGLERRWHSHHRHGAAHCPRCRSLHRREPIR